MWINSSPVQVCWWLMGVSGIGFQTHKTFSAKLLFAGCTSLKYKKEIFGHCLNIAGKAENGGNCFGAKSKITLYSICSVFCVCFSLLSWEDLHLHAD